MKDSTKNRRSYPNLEQFTTPELEALLQQDFAVSGEENPDLELIMAAMEVIQRRESALESQADVDAAWDDFKTRFISPDQTAQLGEVVISPPMNPMFFSQPSQQ